MANENTLSPQEKAKKYISIISKEPNDQKVILDTVYFRGLSINEVNHLYNQWLIEGLFHKILFVTPLQEDSSMGLSRCGIIVTYEKIVNSHDIF